MFITDEKDAATETSLADIETSEERPLENGEIKPSPSKEGEEEESEVSDSEGEETEEAEEELAAKSNEQKPKKKGGFQKRIDKLNVRLSQAEQEREYWRQQTLRNTQQTQAQEPVVKTDVSKRPKADDFQTVDDYQEALTDWKVDQKIQAREEKLRMDTIKNEFQTKASEHSERVKTLSRQKDDWEDVQDVFKRVQVSATVEQLILDAGDTSAELVYELGKDEEELQRICRMPALQAAKAIGRIEARLSKPPTPPKKEQTTTKTPKPPTPVRAKGTNAPKGFSREMTMKEYEAWRNSQQKRQ